MDNGKATIIAAIIAAVATIVAAVIGVTMQKQNTELQQENSSLQAENTESQSEISELRDKISKMENMISALQNENVISQDGNTSLQDENAQLKSKISDLESQISELKSNHATVPDDEGAVDWMQELPPYMVDNHTAIYDGSDRAVYFTVAGVNYTSGIWFGKTSRNWVGPFDAWAIWNTNGKYSTMNFTVCATSVGNATMSVLLNGEPYKTYNLKWDDPQTKITIPLDFAENIKVNFSGSQSPQYGMYDIAFN